MHVHPPANISPLEIGFAVTDLDRSLAFYRDALGFAVISIIATPKDKALLSGIADTSYTVVRLQLPTGERVKLFRLDSPADAEPKARRPLDGAGFAFMTLILSDIAAAVAHLGTFGISPRGDGI